MISEKYVKFIQIPEAFCLQSRKHIVTPAASRTITFMPKGLVLSPGIGA